MCHACNGVADPLRASLNLLGSPGRLTGPLVVFWCSRKVQLRDNATHAPELFLGPTLPFLRPASPPCGPPRQPRLSSSRATMAASSHYWPGAPDPPPNPPPAPQVHPPAAAEAMAAVPKPPAGLASGGTNRNAPPDASEAWRWLGNALRQLEDEVGNQTWLRQAPYGHPTECKTMSVVLHLRVVSQVSFSRIQINVLPEPDAWTLSHLQMNVTR